MTKDHWPILLILTVTFFLMSPALKNDFVAWDDDIHIYKNKNVLTLTLESAKQILTTPIKGNYHPLTTLTFALEHHFFGLDPFWFHLNNILLHLACTFLVFRLMLLLNLETAWALLVALLFGIQPMRVESVAWITERKDVLFGIFYLAALIQYLLYQKHGKRKYMVLVYLFFVPALLSKIQAVSLPLSMLLLDYLLDRPFRFRLIVEKIPYFLLSLMTGLVGIFLLKQNESLGSVDHSFFEGILIGTYSLSVYLVKSIFPYEMAAIYSFPNPGQLGTVFYLSPLLLIGLGYALFRSTRITKKALFGSLFFLVNIIFLLQVVNSGQAFLADRFTYIPYIGLFYLYGSGAAWLWSRKESLRPLMAIFLVGTMLGYGWVTWKGVSVWKNTETLFTHVLARDKDNIMALQNRGGYYKKNKQYKKAIQDYTHALAIDPNETRSLVDRGTVLFNLGRFDEALQDLNRAIKIKPKNSNALANRGSIFGVRKQYGKALEDLNQALLLDPESTFALSNRFVVFFYLHKYDKALADGRSVLQLKPHDHQMQNRMGACREQMGNLEGALADYSRAIQLSPQEATYFLARSYLYRKMGQKDRALLDAQEAVQRGGKVDPAYLEELMK